MKRIRTVLALLLAASLQASVPREWPADVRHPAAWQTSAYRGETVELVARLVDNGRPFAVPAGATAKMLVSTNDFATPPWQWPAAVSPSGVVRATWLPEYDPGASSVRIFLGVSEGGTNWNYGANCTMRLLGSPGASPGALPLPAASIDFAAVRVANAPWPDFGAASNMVAEAIAGIDFPDTSLEPATNYTDSVAAGIRAETASGIAAAARAGTNYTDAVALAFEDGSRRVFRASYADTADRAAHASAAGSGPDDERSWDDVFVALDAAVHTDEVPLYEADPTVPAWAKSATPSFAASAITSGTLAAARIPNLNASKITAGTLVAARIPGLDASKITSGTLAAARLPSATATTVGAVRPDGETTTVASGVLSAQPALDSAMSYTDVSIGAITNSEFVATNGTLALYAPWNGVMTNIWSSDSYADSGQVAALVSELQSLAARVRALEQNSGAGAQFWNRYAASGAANPDYENITVLNRAMTMFAAGFDIETSGAYGVFVQSGTVAFPSGGDGHFRFSVGTNEWFGVEVGGRVMVGAVAQSIRMGDGVAFIDYPYSGTGDFPTIEMCTSLALMDWTTITPTWYDNGDGTATATCPATASSGFYRGWTSHTVASRFSTPLPIEAGGGIMCEDRIHVAFPVYSNGSVTWRAQ